MLHNYIDEPLVKIKAQPRYTEAELIRFLQIHQGEKKSGKILE